MQGSEFKTCQFVSNLILLIFKCLISFLCSFENILVAIGNFECGLKMSDNALNLHNNN